MLKKLRALREEHERGFTLVEMLVVILILGILAAIAIPQFLGQRESAVDATVESDVTNTKVAVGEWSVKNPNKSVPKEVHLSASGETTGFIKTPLATIAANALNPNVLDVKLSPGNNIIITPNESSHGDYCSYGFNPSGDRSAVAPGIIFDSQKGGLNRDGWCGANIPAEVEKELGGGNTGGGGGLEVPDDENQLITIDRTTNEEVVVSWKFVKSYSMQKDRDVDFIDFTVKRKSDGQPLNGVLYHWQNMGSQDGYSLVENGHSKRNTSLTMEDTPIPVNNAAFTSGKLADANTHFGSAYESLSFTAPIRMGGGSAPTSLKGTLDLFGNPKRGTPDSIGGTLDVNFPAKSEGRRVVDIEALNGNGRTVWEARAYSATSKNGVTEFHTKSLDSDRQYGDDPVKKIKVTVALDMNSWYETTVTR